MDEAGPPSRECERNDFDVLSLVNFHVFFLFLPSIRSVGLLESQSAHRTSVISDGAPTFVSRPRLQEVAF